MAFDQFCERLGQDTDDPVQSMLHRDKDRVAGIRRYFEQAIVALIRSDEPRRAITEAVAHFTAACNALRAWQMEQFPGLTLEQIAAVETLDLQKDLPCLRSLKNASTNEVQRALEVADVEMTEADLEWANARIVALCVSTRRIFLVSRIAIAATPDSFVGCRAEFENQLELPLHRRALDCVRKLVAFHGMSEVSMLCIKSIEGRINWLEKQTPQTLVKAVTLFRADPSEGHRFTTGGRTR